MNLKPLHTHSHKHLCGWHLSCLIRPLLRTVLLCTNCTWLTSPLSLCWFCCTCRAGQLNLFLFLLVHIVSSDNSQQSFSSILSHYAVLHQHYSVIHMYSLAFLDTVKPWGNNNRVNNKKETALNCYLLERAGSRCWRSHQKSCGGGGSQRFCRLCGGGAHLVSQGWQQGTGGGQEGDKVSQSETLHWDGGQWNTCISSRVNWRHKRTENY